MSYTKLKNLGALYRRQGKYEAAETLEDCAMRSSSSKHPLDMNRLRNTRRPNESNSDMKYDSAMFQCEMQFQHFSLFFFSRGRSARDNAARRGSHESLDSVQTEILDEVSGTSVHTT